MCEEFRKKTGAIFHHNFFYKMCDSGSFLGPAVQLLTLDAFKTEPLEQKLTMTTLLPPVQELLFKGPQFLEGFGRFGIPQGLFGFILIKATPPRELVQ